MKRNAVIAALLLVLASVPVAGQGTVVFDGQVGAYGTNYYESGMWFRVVVPPAGGPYHDGMVIVPGNRYQNVPQNATPFMGFFQQYNPDDYVAFSLTNGTTFGLASVDLADPNSPSLAPVPIAFVGFLAGGTTVTNTFTTPGNGATTFQNYQFTPAFASGLLSVSIFSTRWAIDNLVFTIPEPVSGSLLLLGLLALCVRRWRRRSGS